MNNKQKIRFRHNKKKNTCVLYETLVQELTSCILKKDEIKKDLILNILKEFFKSPKILKKELILYETIKNTKDVEKDIAEKIIFEAKRQYDLLDKKEIIKQQTKLVGLINTKLSRKIFDNFIPDYKSLASIFQIFNGSGFIKNKILLEQELINKMISGQNTKNNKENNISLKELERIDQITFKLLLKKFEEKYKTSLIKEQKELISNYVIGFSDNNLSLKVFLNEEIERLKIEINCSLKKSKEIKENKDLSDMTNKLFGQLDIFKKQNINEEMLVNLMKIQSFIFEANEV